MNNVSDFTRVRLTMTIGAMISFPKPCCHKAQSCCLVMQLLQSWLQLSIELHGCYLRQVIIPACSPQSKSMGQPAGSCKSQAVRQGNGSCQVGGGERRCMKVCGRCSKCVQGCDGGTISIMMVREGA